MKTYKYLGQKIRNDFRNVKSKKFKQDLQWLRTRETGSTPIYTMVEGKYTVDNCPMVTGPIIKKVGTYSPQLTAEVICRFAGRCHACGFANCPQKGNPQKTEYRCIHEKEADSWWPCEKCMRSFHLAKDWRLPCPYKKLDQGAELRPPKHWSILHVDNTFSSTIALFYQLKR